MKNFMIRAEYGIQEGQIIVRNYRAQNADNARKRFIKEMKKESLDNLNFSIQVLEK
jgi:hypothetical protein